MSEDVYMTSNPTIQELRDTPGIAYSLLGENTYQSYEDAAELCFPGVEERLYCRHFWEQGRNVIPGKILITVVALAGQKVVGFNSVIIDERLKMAYLHNGGVMPKFRRRGIFINTVLWLTKEAIKHGVSKVYGIVERGGASHKIFQKVINYDEGMSFYLYNK